VAFTEVLIMRHHAFAAAMGIVTAALLAPSSQSLAASADPTGYWMKPDAERESKIQVFKCGAGKKLLCAKIAWLKDPVDSRGQPLHDIRNEDPSKRGRAIVGLAIFSGLAPSAPSTWTGQIYNPEDGHTYSATLTVISRRQITLRGCKAWLLCGEKQWLRTAAPEELTPAAPPEGTEQIEASAEPATPPSVPDMKPAAVAEATPAAPAPQAEVQALAAPEAPAKPQQAEVQEANVAATPVSLVTQDVASPVAAPAEVNARRGYGFLNVSTSPDTAARLSGENVSSMFVMTKPLATEAVTPESTNKSTATAALQSDEAAPAPAPKPKPKPKPIATAAAQPAPKTATAPKPVGQAAPAPHDTAQASAEDTDATAADATAGADTPQTAEAAMVEPVPLTRRQRRLLRKQQQQEGQEFLPWLR
jgi:uncharacterized protein (DUF2147 family)